VLRAITKLLAMRERSVVKSSVMASAKYSCSGSLDKLAKGNTTIESGGASTACLGPMLRCSKSVGARAAAGRADGAASIVTA